MFVTFCAKKKVMFVTFKVMFVIKVMFVTFVRFVTFHVKWQAIHSQVDVETEFGVFKYVLSTMGVSKQSISKFLIGNRFRVKLRILSPENCKQSLQVKS